MAANENDSSINVNRLFIFFASIYFIQGLTQGGPSGIFYLPVTFMLKNKLGFDQSQLAYFDSFMIIPWAIKPLYGLLSDFVPIFGYRRKSWYVVAASLGIFCSLYLALFCNYTMNQLLLFMVGQSLSFALCDVLCDALMIEFGKPLKMTDKFQGIQWTAICGAGVLAGIGGGLIAAHLSYKHMFFLMIIPSLAVLFFALFYIPEKRYQYKELKKSEAESITSPYEVRIIIVLIAIATTILLFLNHEYWKMPILKLIMLIAPFLILGSLSFLFRKTLDKKTYFCMIFLFWWSFSLRLTTSPFFYYKNVTLGFPETIMGYLQTTGGIGGTLGAFIFLCVSSRKLYWKNRFLVETSLSRMLRWTGFFGILLIISSFFLIGAKSAMLLAFGESFIYLFANLTILVLAAKFCPPKIAATFFALLMSVINLGTSMAYRVSGMLFDALLKISPQNYADNFWAQFLVWIGWPEKHAFPEQAKCEVFEQYHVIGWLIIIALCAYSLYFVGLKFFGETIKEKGELKSLDISRPKNWLDAFKKKGKN